MQPLTLTVRSRPGVRRARTDRRGVAAMEFAMVAPLFTLLIWGVYDIARALLAWEETCHAAQAIAQAAEKLSVTSSQYPNGKPITSLTSTQMQQAMTSIYAEMPWLNLGNGTGAFTGSFGVTLSGVAFVPTCAATQNGYCAPQLPSVLWSSYLTEGGAQQLLVPPLNNPTSLRYRPCGSGALGVGSQIPVPQFPNNSTQLQYMIDPDMTVVAGGNSSLNLIPQVVADVVYTFTPSFPLLSGKTFTFWASATFPAPLGGDDQEIVFDEKDSPAANTVENCPTGNPVTQ